jgi:hypothetical protein
MLDFSKIRSDQKSQNNAFEELICQIAFRQKTKGEFRRIEGSGGDGGVECYWQLINGEIIGYQAKYFLSTKEIDWKQIDKSVKQALDTYPALTIYKIAIPCDLTGKRGLFGLGKSGWDKWNFNKAKWEKWASDKSMNVTFEPMLALEIRNFLISPEAIGMREYWFDIDEFAPAWVQSKLKVSLSSLGERYHPKDHVNVQAQKVISGLVRDDQLYEDFEKLISDPKLNMPSIRGLEKEEDIEIISSARARIKELINELRIIDIRQPLYQVIPISEVEMKCNEIIVKLSEIRNWQRERMRSYNYKDVPWQLEDLNKKIHDIHIHNLCCTGTSMGFCNF